jgi:hypothetical protein
MASSLPYESATAGDKALVELQRVLQKFGCQSFGTMFDIERGATIVQFKWQGRVVNLEASWRGYAAAWLKAHPWSYGRGLRTRAEYDARALDQAKISVCSILRDWVKGQVTAVECGVMSFEAAFMAHFLLPTGERMVDYVQSQKLLAPPEPQKVVDLKR